MPHDRIDHRQAFERLAEVEVLTLEVDDRRAEHALRDFAEQRFRQIHQIAIVRVRLIELEHREFRIVPRRQPFVAEIAVDFEHPLEAADDEPLQIQLRRDPQIQFHVERVVMRDERPRRGAADDRMHHRRFDFQIATRDEERADRLDQRAARLEQRARFLVHHQVEIALPRTRFLIRQAMEFFRQRAHRLREHARAVRFHRQLAFVRAEQRAGDADDVADVPQVVELLIRLVADLLAAHVTLNAARRILQREEARFAHHAAQHHATRDGCFDLQPFEFFFDDVAVLRLQIGRVGAYGESRSGTIHRPRAAPPVFRADAG